MVVHHRLPCTFDHNRDLDDDGLTYNFSDVNDNSYKNMYYCDNPYYRYGETSNLPQPRNNTINLCKGISRGGVKFIYTDKKSTV